MKNLKHRLASEHDKKPTVSHSDIVSIYGETNADCVKLFYNDQGIVVEYKNNRQNKTWQATTILPDNMQTPKVGEPVFYNVTNYVELLSDELQLIRYWANDRNLIAEGDVTTQFLKLTEEIGELAQSIFKKQDDEFVDALGDIVVVLTNMAAMKGVKLEHCVNSAYNVIKDRKGKMINGTFVKEI